MKETERRKGPNIRERTTPARGDGKDHNVQERNGGRNLKAKEANVKPSFVKRGSNTVVVSNPSISTESSEVYEDMVVDYVDDVCGSEDESVHSAKALAVNENSNGNSSDMEMVDGSDTEAINDSVSSQADSQTADEDKADKVTSIAKTTAKKSSCDYSHTARSRSGMKADTMRSRPRKENLVRGAKTEKGTKLAIKSSSDNLRIQKVHPEALSDSSEDAAVKPTEQKNNEAVQDDASNGAPSVYSNDAVNTEEDNEHEDDAGTDQRIEEMETKIKILESELREVAALEIALYSVVPEHSSSAHKVHTPARRLSRFYFHACKYWSPDRRATTARNIVSGLALVAKSCGNDVSRLTFWLSNSIVLREIISQAFGSSCHSSALAKVEPKAGVKKNGTKSSPNKSKRGNEGRQLSNQGFLQFIDDWEETRAFTAALEKVESWIFLRIVESIWWQTLTPNMQSPAGASITRKSSGKLLGPALGNQQQGSFSINLWNDAFHDSLRRLCPVRAVGNECGCLPVLAKKVMGQCIGRLDVAMFNAILRESAHEIPTDPVSDPIVDTKVLPIPAGDLSFGSGAQLKNSVGQWARWLSDSLGIDVVTKQKNVKKIPDYSEGDCEETECFPLLNALSDLLMLPKDMLMDRTVRLEVCPSISPPLVKRVLCNFTPDEFWPDPVPGAVLEALNAECIIERTLSGEPATSFPYPAAPVVYQPPTLSNVAEKVAEASKGSQLSRSVSSVQKKGYTSDEELDEVESCLTSTIYKSSSLSLNETVDGANTRYDLLREVWHET